MKIQGGEGVEEFVTVLTSCGQGYGQYLVICAFVRTLFMNGHLLSLHLDPPLPRKYLNLLW